MIKKFNLKWFKSTILCVFGVILCVNIGLGQDLIQKKIKKQRLVFLTADQLARKIRAEEVSSAEVVEAYLAHIDRFNPEVNAIVTLDAKGARRRAREADEAIKRGALWGPLHGVPITIKDNLAVKGMRTTSGYEAYADVIPDEDATVVARLRNAGAVILGKTNMPPFGLDDQTYNELFGTTNNPWDFTKTPGGSSGGCAAAVAAGLTPLSVGNDIGGSIRFPAHYCSVFGLKPTDHLVSKAGLLPKSKEFKSLRYLLSNGPIARSVKDLRLALSIIGGADIIDADVPAFPLHIPTKKAVDELRIGWTETFGDVYVTKETRRVFTTFIETLTRKKLHLTRSAPPDFDYAKANETFFALLAQETMIHESRFSRFLLSDVPAYKTVFPLSLKTYMKTLDQREYTISQWEHFLAAFDVRICPVTPALAFTHRKADSSSEGLRTYKTPVMEDGQVIDRGGLTQIFNLTGHPVVVIPIGFTQAGLPVGVQLVGRRWHDMALLNVAEQIVEMLDPFIPSERFVSFKEE
jgi:amidase